MYQKEVMFLTGAGASIPVGIPGMAQMAERFHKEVAREKYPREGLRALRSYGAGSDVEELLQLANAIIAFPDARLGTFIEECVRGNSGNAKFLGDFSRRRNKVVRDVAAFRDRLLEWLTQVCLGFNREQAYSLFSDFVIAVSNHGLPVFTTNYDGVLEYVASRSNVPVVDNFVRRGTRFFWDPTLDSFQGAGIRLIKLHGSIYWHADASGEIERVDPPVRYNSEGKPVERLLIVPTRFKDIYQRNYFPLYTSFLRTLGRAKVLVIIGHSMRDEYLLAAVRDRLRDSSFRLVIIDPGFPAKDDILAGVQDRLRQVVHLNRRAEDTKELLSQISELGDDGSGVFDLAENAGRAIKSRASPKVEIPAFGQWVDAGKQVGLRVRVRTTKVAGLVSAAVELNKDRKKVVDLASHVSKAWGEPPQLVGFQDRTRVIRFYCPKSWGAGPHQFRVKLTDAKGKVLAQDVRPFRVKGSK